MVAKIFQTLKVDLLASIQATGDLSYLVRVDAGNDLNKNVRGPAVFRRLALSFENCMKRMSTIDNAVHARIVHFQDSLTSLVVEGKISSDERDASIALMKASGLLR